MFFHKRDNIFDGLPNGIVAIPFVEKSNINIHRKEFSSGTKIVVFNTIKVCSIHVSADAGEIHTSCKSEALTKNIKSKGFAISFCNLIFNLGIFIPVFKSFSNMPLFLVY